MMNNIKDFEHLFSKKDKINNRNKAIIYTRVSTKEQAENNNSLETQKTYCESYAKNNGLDVIQYFGGTYESAKTDERKEFQRMIKYARNNATIGYILIYSYDRFSRTGTNASYIVDELKKQGINLIAVTQKVDTSNAGGIMQQDFFFLLSRFDNEMRRDKTKSGMVELFRKGYWLWSPPRGYENKNKFQRAIDWKIEINQEGELLQKAFEWRVNNTFSVAEIARKLNNLGMKIDEKRLHDIFKNPFYCGVLTTKMAPGEYVIGKHKAIVSREDFIKINTPDNITVSKIYETMSDDLPLKKSLFCPKCGNLMTGFLVKAKNIHYYKCQKHCHGVSINAKKLHMSFSELLKNYKLNINGIDKTIIQEIMLTKINDTFKNNEKEILTIKNNIKKLNQEIETIEERHALGKIDVNVYTKFREKYKLEIEELTKNIDNPVLTSSNLEKVIQNAVKLASKLNELWDSLDLFNKHKFQYLLFPDGFTFDKKNNTVQTKRANVFFELIHSISNVLMEIKNGDPVLKNQISARVTS